MATLASAPSSALLDAALNYAKRGIPVFPCRADNKRPHLEHGFQDASTDADAIRGWWARWPDAMVACPTGPAIGAWVLDVDDPGVFEAAADAIGLALPATRKALTGKGYHLYFTWDDERPVRNKQRTPKGWAFPSLPGAETRGDGGYIILPPSVHPSGRVYAWERDEAASEGPDELLSIVTAKASADKPANDKGLASMMPAGGNSPYGMAALDNECAGIISAPDGAQEAALNEAGLKIGALVAGGELSLSTAKARLIGAGLAMASHNANDPWTTDAVVAKLERALADGHGTPRSAPVATLNVRPMRQQVGRSDASEHGGGDGTSTARPVIHIRAGDLHTMASEAEAALISTDAPLYDRGGLVRPVVDEMPAAHGKRTKVARLVPVDVNTIVDHLSRSSDWMKWNSRKNCWVAADPPFNVAAVMLSRDGEWTFPKLAGAITAPTLRPDGSLLTKPGYDPQTRLVLLDPPALPPISDAPSKDDAKRALALLDALLDGFPFVDEPSRSVALSALITPVVRGAMPVAPLHAASAPVAGSGKSYLVDLASVILTGDSAPVIAAGRTEEETEKRLGAALLSGQPIVSVDNVNGRLGGDSLCQLIERPVVSVRPLGVSKLIRIESRATTFATGNNILLVGDMTRRTILCSLDPNMERPELREFGSNPRQMILADRGGYIAAALTVVRAYIAAGFPGRLSPLASFEAWSNFVRSALVWLGGADPLLTMEAARADDPELSMLGALLAAWYAAIGSEGRTAGGIVDQAGTRNTFDNLIHADLQAALLEVADDNRGGINSKRLGNYLKAREGRIVGGLRIGATVDSHSKQNVWKVSKA